MLLKAALIITLHVLVFTQGENLNRKKGGANNAAKAMIRFVEIANATYFIDTSTGFYRNEAKKMCESKNMTMISFHEDEEKWLAIKKWLEDNGDYNQNFFWTDALKNEATSEWYWESSGSILMEEDFHWGVGQPSMKPNETVRSCINFSYTGGGYDDDDCLHYSLDALCQYTHHFYKWL